MIAAATQTSADVIFDPARHVYTLPDGERIPSVTQVLQGVGVSMDFDGLAGRAHYLSEAIAAKRDLGHALHADAHAYDDDDLVWASVDPRVEPYLTAWAIFRQNSGVIPTTRERRLFHPTYRYAGTLDGIFRKPDGGRVLIDLKTGDPDDAGCAYQTAAYLAAYLTEQRCEEAIERWAVQLTPEARVPYRVTPYRAWDDFAKFQAFLTTYLHQCDRRRARRG